ncbi:MAG: DinB family protein [Terriglobia bacterium]
MKRIVPLLLALMVTPIAFAQTQAERDRAAKHLEATRQALLGATSGLTEAQWNFKPAPDRWSVAEVLEHIAVAEDALRTLIVKRVMTTPPVEAQEDVKQGDETVLTAVPDRSRKFQAPKSIQPTGRFGSPKNSMQHFRESRDQTIDFVMTTPDLRLHAADSPFGRKFDAYQWVLFISAHCQRHIKQINEVKADPNFPTP